ncbi:wlac protein [Pedobacter sp. BAL39]|uniref:glycosyltransferase n=1 Tax=Pedobacter sp. BAL39 TaxID=391596 RepID=UPI0001559A9B|nr:glycosyltransferase [Pedobacter sp. BAL39]EDM38330.1 wlac protein [Pedobacter sp. BAL39]
MERTKLVFVIYSLHKGGAERVLSTLSNSFSSRDYEVTIICIDEANPGYPIAADVRVISLMRRADNQHLLNRIRYAALTYTRMLRLFRKIQPYCVISFMTSANLWTGICCGMLGIPYIVSERTTPDHTINSSGYLLRQLSYRVYRRSKAIVLPAKGIEICLKKNRTFSKLLNYNIIKNPVYEFKETTEQCVHHKKFILGVGRLSKVKGFDLLITAFSQLKVNNIDLLILGNGPERNQLEDQISVLGLDGRVFLPGAKDELQDYYAQASLFVLPSRNEGYPNALIEAMAAGCACIAADCEFGPSEIITHENNGLLVPVADTLAMTKAMFEVLFNKGLRHYLGQNAKTINETNSLQVISDQWEELILAK